LREERSVDELRYRSITECFADFSNQRVAISFRDGRIDKIVKLSDQNERSNGNEKRPIGSKSLSV
jgi:hypothetical protein